MRSVAQVSDGLGELRGDLGELSFLGDGGLAELAVGETVIALTSPLHP